ncbi:endolytic transglycosylase MltG [Actinospica robiniae]|uniref:endolytic transglycosylase MltG n=1 Tax=Actinospica robiniae TaxID=304901 RepID=UPI0004272E19|nr:endolytic transglycosylase MltG [Actinospica robiniae]
MSDGGWYGYPQEPDPYAQAQDDWSQPPLDYSNPPQAPGYPSYGQGGQGAQTGQQSAAQYFDYPQQQQQQPQQQAPRPPQQDPRYRQQQQRPQQPQQPQQQPRYPQQGQQQGQQGYASGSYDTGYDTGGYGGQQRQRGTGQQPRVGYEGYPASGYDTGSHGSGSYNSGSYGAQGYPSSGGYDTGTQQQRAAARPQQPQRRPAGPGPGPTDPYGEPRDARGPRDVRDPYNDLAEDQAEYEYPARGGRRRAEPEQPVPSRSGSNPRYAVEDEESERGGLLTADSSDSDGDSGGRRTGSGKKGNKRKSCLAVFVLFSILAGLLGYGGFQGYKWYQSKYGPPPDFTSAAGLPATVVVEIPGGSGGTAIGSILLQNDVVKSQRAFTKACEANPKCGDIQANTYLLHKEMSAAAAVDALLNTSNIDNTSQLLVRPGERAADVFKDLEQKKKWTQAQILSAISSGKVDLPSWANAKTGAKFPFANVEGLLFTGTYQLPDYNDPTSLIKTMIDKQLAMFDAVGLTSKAKSAGGANLTPYQVLTIASMARAEAGTDTKDLGKIAGVIYHRLKDTADFAHLGFDTTTLYGMGETTTTPDNKATGNPYNTSVFGIKGLPPGPIDSIDQTTLEAALSPTDTTDLYFCAVDGSVLYAANSTAWSALGKAHPGLCGN